MNSNLNEEKINRIPEKAPIASKEVTDTQFFKMEAEAGTNAKLSTNRALSEYFLERKDLEGLDFEIIKNGKYYMRGDLAKISMKKYGAAILRVKREKRAQRLNRKLSKLETKTQANGARAVGAPREPNHARVELVNDSTRKQWQHLPVVNHSFFRQSAPLFTSHRGQFLPFYSSNSGSISRPTNMLQFPLHYHPYHFLPPLEQQARIIQHANKSMPYTMFNTNERSSEEKRANKTTGTNTFTSFYHKKDLINPMSMRERDLEETDCLNAAMERSKDNVQLNTGVRFPYRICDQEEQHDFSPPS